LHGDKRQLFIEKRSRGRGFDSERIVIERRIKGSKGKKAQRKKKSPDRTPSGRLKNP